MQAVFQSLTNKRKKKTLHKNFGIKRHDLTIV